MMELLIIKENCFLLQNLHFLPQVVHVKEIINCLTEKGTRVGLLCSVIVTQRASDRENDLGGFGKKETTEGKRTHCYENKGTLKIGQAFAENQ